MKHGASAETQFLVNNKANNMSSESKKELFTQLFSCFYSNQNILSLLSWHEYNTKRICYITEIFLKITMSHGLREEKW